MIKAVSTRTSLQLNYAMHFTITVFYLINLHTASSRKNEINPFCSLTGFAFFFFNEKLSFFGLTYRLGKYNNVFLAEDRETRST